MERKKISDIFPCRYEHLHLASDTVFNRGAHFAGPRTRLYAGGGVATERTKTRTNRALNERGDFFLGLAKQRDGTWYFMDGNDLQVFLKFPDFLVVKETDRVLGGVTFGHTLTTVISSRPCCENSSLMPERDIEQER
jgi:hypothetical protein